MENYRIIRKVGSGNFAQVYLAVHEETGKQVALKLIAKKDITGAKSVEQVQQEIANMRKLRHPNVAELYESFETDQFHVLVMEYVPSGELFDYVFEKQGLAEDEARKIFREVVEAVKHCHENSIVHRDLKLENILLSRDGHVKLADFGFSKTTEPNELLTSYCGSPLYASPEMVLGKPYSGPECDVWSLGVVLFATLTASMPFDDRNLTTFMLNLERGDYPEPSGTSELAKHLISRMLDSCAATRATISDILSHPWMRSGTTRKISMNMVNRQRKSITLCYSRSEASEITRKLAEMNVNGTCSHNAGSTSPSDGEVSSSSSCEDCSNLDHQWMISKNTSNCSSGYGSGEEEEEEEEFNEEDLVLV